MTNLVTVPQGGDALDILAARYRAAFDKMTAGREQWIEGTFELMAVMSELRGRFPDHREFSRWLERHELQHITHQDRAALLGFAKNSEAARKMMEQSSSRSWRGIWEKVPKRTLTGSGKGDNSRGRRASGHEQRKRARRVPDVMKEPIPQRPLKDLSAMFLKPEQVDPDFKGTALEFATKYGHVPLHTKDQLEENKRQQALATWIGAVTEHARTARVLLATPAPDPATLQDWMSKPAKAEKFRIWLNTIEATYRSIVPYLEIIREKNGST